MLYITWTELNEKKVNDLENAEFNRLYNNLAEVVGYNLADKIVKKILDKKLSECLNCSGIDLLKGFKIL